ncbi:MAG: hypothetical protein A3D67_04225 [Candidatus Lloydbacteria bacterium RIFCSPHIGHO2_02_FULL_51_22]|uniref:Cytidyltransferase-like domain-containing protein n=2 Tax=Candidatus Lloydiibacteriota TaxID=1817910 RepID=A0A1G2DG25_9BACT|nr:MAG: hypothetical protein A3D67_04225 [Candidatus Lloydbacteria bacterium RIFCSPHIGHO2_02_FULL_51_22]OGZ17339.1 MAG: hypothetical protein A3G11_00195 [Candidatus Lloydbacteria bacterium RIFCSPLOWO2_12_FULL_51_9]
MKKKVAVLTSGGFDPMHVGHFRCMEAAKKLGGYLIVVVNGDSWLKRKKGRVFMPAKDRAEIIKGLACVDEVYILNSERDDVGEALERFKPAIFAKGGDRTSKNIPERGICKKLGIKVVYGVGGGKIQSSSELLEKYLKQGSAKHVKRRK